MYTLDRRSIRGGQRSEIVIGRDWKGACRAGLIGLAS